MPNDPHKILIVEDHENTRTLYAAEFRDAGYAVVTAENGIKALAVLEQEPFDLVMTDLMMPEIEGSTVIMYMRKYLPKVPVIIVSAYNEEAKYHGLVKGFFLKPVDMDKLKQAVKDLLAAGPV